MNAPAHEHDCDRCIFIGSYRLRHPYTDDGALEGDPTYAGYRTGVPGKVVTMGDVYLACGGSSYRYIVRYGICGEYATTNVVAHYLLAPMVDGTDDDFDSRPLLEQLQEANANAPDWRDIALPFDDIIGEAPRVTTNLTPKMRYALDLLQSSNEERHAVTCTQPTRPVGENDVFVNVSTARALVKRGLLTFSGGGVEPGYEWVSLTEAGRA